MMATTFPIPDPSVTDDADTFSRHREERQDLNAEVKEERFRSAEACLSRSHISDAKSLAAQPAVQTLGKRSQGADC